MKKDFSLFLKDAQNNGCLNYKENLRLSSVSSIGTGGEASFFVTPFSSETLIKTVKSARDNGIAFTVIGNATNILFPDEGFDGAVISTRKMNAVSVKDGLILADCGVSLPKLSSLALENAFTGFEGLVSIPATVGGALVTNAGAYGCEIADSLLSFSVFLPESGEVKPRLPKDYPFSYRLSHATDGGAIILSAIFEGKPGTHSEISAKMSENREKRRASQPTGVKSVGSFFKKPDYATLNKSVSPDYFGKSAGELIDLCGFKGMSVGGACVSEKHAGFLINLGNATTADFLQLSEIIKRKVFEKTGVRLTEECVIIQPRNEDG